MRQIDNITKLRTTPRNKEIRTPREIPVEILGSKTPTTPPTNAPITTRVVSITPKSFIFGSRVLEEDIC